MKDPMIQHSYNIAVLPRPAKPGEVGSHGWIFGLPPGIKPEQWPLDPWNGYPLMHGFTLLLPEDYRVHGQEIVALSFFATAPCHNDGQPVVGHEALFDLITAPGDKPPVDGQLRPFWERASQVHPRTHRITDMLSCAYAVVLLTQAEFDGPHCQPKLVSSVYLDEEIEPGWPHEGSASIMWEGQYSPAAGFPMQDYATYKMIGQVPDKNPAFNRAIRWSPRALDPNAGKVPRESDGGNAGAVPPDGGYQSPNYWEGGVIERENYRNHSWATYADAHIGGTMQPAQGVPDMSPFYIEFGEDFGGYNIGGSIAQLDFRDMKLDWAC